MSICRDKASKIKYTELKQCRCQNVETRKSTQIYRNKKLQMPICGNKETKVKYMELKYCRCQYEQI